MVEKPDNRSLQSAHWNNSDGYRPVEPPGVLQPVIVNLELDITVEGGYVMDMDANLI